MLTLGQRQYRRGKAQSSSLERQQTVEDAVVIPPRSSGSPTWQAGLSVFYMRTRTPNTSSGPDCRDPIGAAEMVVPFRNLRRVPTAAGTHMNASSPSAEPLDILWIGTPGEAQNALVRLVPGIRVSAHDEDSALVVLASPDVQPDLLV